jgi:glycerophosphoryl diester phosphodiesterase
MKLIAHRGASGYCPENTIPSFKKAVKMGAEMIELDVQMTKDGEIVVFHDFTVERTSDGKGFIKDLTLEYLKTLDAGKWFNKDFSGTKISTLKEVFEIIPSTIIVNVELKKLGIDQRNMTNSVYQVVKDANRQDSVIYSSFDHHLLLELQNLGAIKLEILIRSNMIKPWLYLNDSGLKCQSINQTLAFVNKDIVDGIHKHGYKINCDTVNEKEQAKLLEEVGVDAIFTNYLDILD